MMKLSSMLILKVMLLFCAICALVPAVWAAPQWDYVYLSTATTPDAYPYGAWGQELYLTGTDTIAPVNGRLHFNLHNDSLFFYWRGEQADPRISSSNFTFEWRQEVLSPGNQFSMVMHYAETQNDWIELTYNWMLMLVADSDVVVLPEFTAGPHTYRLVKRENQVELYVDGSLAATLPAGAYTVNQLELNGWGAEYAPYESYWEHVAYRRGAYAPAELPSPTEVPASTTTCVEVAGVPNWKQFDDGTNTWWDDIYDHTVNRISKSGCNLTAIAQVAKKLGFNKNPAELNTLLNALADGFDAWGFVNPGAVARESGLKYFVTTEDVLRQQLSAGNPVILKLKSLSVRDDGTRPDHFVVATGKCGDKVYINDPGHSSIYRERPTLDQYFTKLPVGLRNILEMRYYTK